jgi:hypothetical protein
MTSFKKGDRIKGIEFGALGTVIEDPKPYSNSIKVLFDGEDYAAWAQANFFKLIEPELIDVTIQATRGELDHLAYEFNGVENDYSTTGDRLCVRIVAATPPKPGPEPEVGNLVLVGKNAWHEGFREQVCKVIERHALSKAYASSFEYQVQKLTDGRHTWFYGEDLTVVGYSIDKEK